MTSLMVNFVMHANDLNKDLQSGTLSSSFASGTHCALGTMRARRMGYTPLTLMFRTEGKTGVGCDGNHKDPRTSPAMARLLRDSAERARSSHRGGINAVG